MDIGQMPDFHQYLQAWFQDIDSLRQSRLLDERSLVRFANDRGINASTGDPGDFFKRGWLASDGINYDGGPLFHPFRIYTLHKILEVCKLNIAQSSTLRREGLTEFIEGVLASLPSVEHIGEMACKWDRIIDLAILLEPIYWRYLTNKTTIRGGMLERDFYKLRDEYHSKVLQMVGTLDTEQWREIHQAIVSDSYWLDPNDKLYLLLRVSEWKRREDLKGQIGGALWFRHIAEVVRRAFER